MVNRRYVVRRFALMLVSLFMVLSVLFVLFRLVPGDPMSTVMDPRMPPEAREMVAEQYGLNEPLYVQYALYMTNVVQGDFGISFYYQRPVFDIIWGRLSNTLALMLTAFVMSYAVGTYLGAHLGWIRGTARERVEMTIVLLIRSAPVFWVGMVMLYVFSFQLGWFPLGGMRSVDAQYANAFEKFLSPDFLYHLVIPVITLSLFYTGLPLLLMRNNLLEVLTEDYIDTARAKGLAERRIMIRHAARNAILPVVTAFAIAVGFSVGGQVLIEQVFSWPGLGREMVQASLRNDYPLAQATFFLLSVIVISMNFMADLAYSYLDPRVQIGGEE
ncbi:ABC transporter permease subunit [Halorubrum sp. JWXQ-INN 858]|uniref:ABC transporter permease n=1 Tax=Halorubrum sp. JWXQ-INN 858 TaxID=2690782 RepID=UPI0013574BCC|nr:ABC transporter permease [Halorubrum sp. JWXQ-INN 858]MWV65072.1 ABC transporter permease subunit [Halorubrum sp. JWXQ-INN 858]